MEARRIKQKRGPTHDGSSPSGAGDVSSEVPPGPTPIAPPEDGGIHGDSLLFSGAPDGPRDDDEMDAPPPPTDPITQAEDESVDRNNVPPSGAHDRLRDDDEMEAAPRSIPVTEVDDERMHLQGSIPPGGAADVSRDDDEMVVPPCTQHMSQQEDEENQQVILPPTGSGDVLMNAGGMEVVPGPTPVAQPPRVESRRGRKRDADWKPDETETLIASRLHPSRSRRKLSKVEWEAISVQIHGRTGKQCRQRWDTLVKRYKMIKGRCIDLGKEFAAVTEEEFRDMKVGSHWKCNNWYNMIDEFRGQRPSLGKSPCSYRLAVLCPLRAGV